MDDRVLVFPETHFRKWLAAHPPSWASCMVWSAILLPIVDAALMMAIMAVFIFERTNLFSGLLIAVLGVPLTILLLLWQIFIGEQVEDAVHRGASS